MRNELKCVRRGGQDDNENFRSCLTCGSTTRYVGDLLINLILTVHAVVIVLCIKTSGGPLSALTCCVNVRLLSAIKKISPLIYSQSWVGSWVYTTQAMMTFTLIF